MEFKKQRVVVKVGTSTITHPSGAPNLRNIEILARTLSDLQDMGHEMILVSSGAIAVGTDKLGLAERPRELRFKQAAASVGQCRLMFTYDKFFSEYGHTVGQILLTDDDVADPSRAAHLEATFSALSEMGVIPIVNENDSVSSAEIETGQHKVLGDNDTLSAMVARALPMRICLVLLSDIDGLYDCDPREPIRRPICIHRVHGTDRRDPDPHGRRQRAARAAPAAWRPSSRAAQDRDRCRHADTVIMNGAAMRKSCYDICWRGPRISARAVVAKEAAGYDRIAGDGGSAAPTQAARMLAMAGTAQKNRGAGGHCPCARSPRGTQIARRERPRM